MSAPAGSRAGDPAPDRAPPPLVEPFAADEVAWTVVEIADAGDVVRIEPRIATHALHERLDAAVGVRGWSVRYAAMPGEAVACHLILEGVTKGVVAAPALVGGGAVTAAVAFDRAAARFGARHPWPAGVSAWVACDPATFEPLHPPEWSFGPAIAPREAPRGPRADGGDEPAAAHAAADAEAGTGGSAPATSEAAPAVPKPEGQQMIDRLIDRLKAQGQGMTAARILVRHGGYGRDPQAARELYAELRQLLLDVRQGPGDAPAAVEEGGL